MTLLCAPSLYVVHKSTEQFSAGQMKKPVRKKNTFIFVFYKKEQKNKNKIQSKKQPSKNVIHKYFIYSTLLPYMLTSLQLRWKLAAVAEIKLKVTKIN